MIFATRMHLREALFVLDNFRKKQLYALLFHVGVHSLSDRFGVVWCKENGPRWTCRNSPDWLDLQDFAGLAGLPRAAGATATCIETIADNGQDWTRLAHGRCWIRADSLHPARPCPTCWFRQTCGAEVLETTILHDRSVVSLVLAGRGAGFSAFDRRRHRSETQFREATDCSASGRSLQPQLTIAGV